MINLILQSFDEKIRNLCWVERYSRSTRLFKRTIINKDREKVTQVYPVSCSVSDKECNETARYADLVPNSKYGSVVYWEQINGIAPKIIPGTSRKRMLTEMSVDMRLVVWTNLARLGITDCGFCHQIFGDLIREINGSHSVNIPEIGVNNIKVEVLGQDPKSTTISSVFGRYSYGATQGLFFYPYDVCSYKIRLTWALGANCLQPSECKEPIECIIL